MAKIVFFLGNLLVLESEDEADDTTGNNASIIPRSYPEFHLVTII